MLAGDGVALAGLRLVNGRAAAGAGPDGGCVLVAAASAAVANCSLANCTAERHCGGIAVNATGGGGIGGGSGAGLSLAAVDILLAPRWSWADSWLLYCAACHK